MGKSSVTTVTWTCDRCGKVWEGNKKRPHYLAKTDGRFAKEFYTVDIGYYEEAEVFAGHPAYCSAHYGEKSREESPDWCDECTDSLLDLLKDNGYFWEVVPKDTPYLSIPVEVF